MNLICRSQGFCYSVTFFVCSHVHLRLLFFICVHLCSSAVELFSSRAFAVDTISFVFET
jgi:hypothetical protein